MTTPNQDEQQIRAVIDTWAKATFEGNLDALLNLMTEDVTFLIPGRPPMHRTEFISAFQSMVRSVQALSRSTVQEITVKGDLALCWNYIEVDIVPIFSGTTTKRAGNTLTAFRRGPDNQWRVWRDANLVTAV
ncbi:hypothetical protein GCM10011507_10690 [Edaphobacter acidisoli]|uniref:DUF4440 domain-containing protein n=1 Tax=Edaphobacter acidisoli TaxID=2040573 RepID=A0A916W2K1_9BACT|nr:SgcJ/EcaC family oxidoreductase [Edaphobacter acidisoli]GGA61048.1 hypothetical protein GCM10011507_10690 [Edaphobacter acidisoli]